MVAQLGIDARADALHVRYGLHLARLHLHNNCHARRRVSLLELIHQRLLGEVLNLQVDRRADIQTVDRLLLDDVRPPSAHAHDGVIARLAVQQRVVTQLQAILALRQSAGFYLIINVADGA